MKELKSTKESNIYKDYERKIEKNARNEDIKSFSKSFNKLLDEKEITNKQFARVANISPSSISNYRSGKTMPGNEILNIIADELDVSVNHLLGIDECKKYSAEQVHNMLGLDEYAMEHLYSLKHNLEEVKSLDDEDPISNVYEEQLKMLNLLIADKRNLIYFLNSIKKYVKKKKELLTFEETKDFFKKNNKEDLIQDIVHIKGEIIEHLYMSLDYIANKFLTEKK